MGLRETSMVKNHIRNVLSDGLNNTVPINFMVCYLRNN